jgi:hypothetical protein
MHADLVKLGFDGSYERVAAFVRARKADRQRAQQTTGRGTFVPLVFQPGEAFQFDWSEDWAVRIGAVFDMTGNKVRLDLGVIDLLVDGFVDSNRRKQAPIVPVTGPMNRILKRLMGQHQEDHLIRSGGEPMSEGARNWTQIIQRLVVRGGAGRTPDQVKRKLLEPTDQGNVNWYSIRRTFADWLDERVSDAAISAVMGHFEISSRTRRQLFEAGSPTTDLYKRRKLGPVMEVGEALEREWWPSIQPFTGVDLRSDVDQRWSQDFGPVVKVDQLVKEVIPNDETKEPFVQLPGSRYAVSMRVEFQGQGCA